MARSHQLLVNPDIAAAKDVLGITGQQVREPEARSNFGAVLPDEIAKGVVAADEINPNQSYLSNRIRPQGVVEKCTFCLHRTREGRAPACLEACPTGARVFGNLLDPDSDIRWVLENKRVYVLKEELGTRPRFFYFFDV